MRLLSLILSFIAVFVLTGGVQAGMLSAPGPNPNWTKMQQFEWYLGYMAGAARTCGAFQEADVIHRLARMTPYGDIGLGAVRGDGFAGPVCGRISNEAKELAADATKIEAYIEETYHCTDEGCYGQVAGSWRDHVCVDELLEHLAERKVQQSDVNSMVFTYVGYYDISNVDYKVTVYFKGCEGSLYLEIKESCRVRKEYTRGDCEVAGVAGY